MKRQYFTLIFAVLLIFLAGGIGFWIGFTANPKTDSPVFDNEKILGSAQPLIAVVPHHDLVKNIRENLLEKLGLVSQPKTIILLSPNHFDAGTGDIVTTKQTWSVANGQKSLSADIELIEDLILDNLIIEDSAAFDNEHGIKNLLGEIKRFFPDSLLVPLIIRNETSAERIKELSDWLLGNCPDCGVIASVDMSHYQPAHAAQIHDIKTLRALITLNDEEIWETEVDSNASLAFLINWAKSNSLNNFILYDHTNSGLIANNFDGETTTHIFGYYDSGLPAQIDDYFTFTFAGDAMFGREIGYQFQQNNFKDLFANIGDRTFWGTDIAWLNLEGPVSDKIVVQPRYIANLVFNFSNQTIKALKYLKLTTVGLANNHTLNQGLTGLSATEKILTDSGLDWHGHPAKINDQSIVRYEQDDIKISLIAVNPTFGITDIDEFIKKEKSNGRFIVVLPHWGNEYQQNHSAGQEKLARAWLASGADMIVGAHPHVIQDAQIIDGKLVFYSLGNFVFDQYFSQETKQGLVITGAISAEKIKIVLLPIESKNLKPEILRGDAKKQILEKICKNIAAYCHGDEIETNLN